MSTLTSLHPNSGNLSRYFDVFKAAASEVGINPVHLISRSAQEGANKADYSAVAGTYTTTYGRTSLQGYSLDGYYNYYNIGSYVGSGYNYTVQRGLAYAAGFLEKDGCFTTNPEGKTYYDEQIIEAPKCFRQIGVFKYQSRNGIDNTVPVVVAE